MSLGERFPLQGKLSHWNGSVPLIAVGPARGRVKTATQQRQARRLRAVFQTGRPKQLVASILSRQSASLIPPAFPTFAVGVNSMRNGGDYKIDEVTGLHVTYTPKFKVRDRDRGPSTRVSHAGDCARKPSLRMDCGMGCKCRPCGTRGVVISDTHRSRGGLMNSARKRASVCWNCGIAWPRTARSRALATLVMTSRKKSKASRALLARPAEGDWAYENLNHKARHHFPESCFSFCSALCLMASRLCGASVLVSRRASAFSAFCFARSRWPSAR